MKIETLLRCLPDDIRGKALHYHRAVPHFKDGKKIVKVPGHHMIGKLHNQVNSALCMAFQFHLTDEGDRYWLTIAIKINNQEIQLKQLPKEGQLL